MDVERLNKAFSNFAAASRVLDASYAMLKDRIEKLTAELEAKNRRVHELELQHERNKRLIAMGEMAANIVHEIRNPLCSIELYATMLEKELVEPSHKGLAAGIAAGIGNLNTILTNMLIFARPHRLALKEMRLDLAVEEAVSSVRPFGSRRNVSIDLMPAQFQIMGDKELLKQAFMNIVINAVQAASDPGWVQVSVEDRGGGAAVVVSDNGEGIKKEYLEKIFDPFFTTKDGGTGLGLAIASKIIQAHGGRISVESEPGKGSTFTIIFG